MNSEIQRRENLTRKRLQKKKLIKSLPPMQILEKQPKSRQNNLWQALALRGGSLLQTLPLPDSCDRQNIPVKRTIPLPF